LAIPVYIYIVSKMVEGFISIQEDMSLTVQDFFSVVTNVIKTSAILYYLFIAKLFNLHDLKVIAKSSRSTLNNVNNLR